MNFYKHLSKDPIRKISENEYWIGVRDKHFKQAIKEKKLMQIDIKGIGTAFVNPKKVVKRKPEPFVGLYPENPMLFYYFKVRVISQEQEERIEADSYWQSDDYFVNSLLK